jgi:hypothetical protein
VHQQKIFGTSYKTFMQRKKKKKILKKSYNISDFKEANRGELFCFNCKEVGHLEHEFPYPKIERDDTEEENSNEEEDNPKIEKEENHEARLEKVNSEEDF